eukprot:CAMPEP_0185018478 /NCGR_PEP_ID=MMETSP1103-20130426/1189_1 /TAXON_ID=36769 /ORGANISM="Paraphysomonas bandaiensis, Strain Caron Lab Isolate" /LENGTH=145 /DNA_ID=CAMNT_0027548301 /DNA_START=51 /DNA_END=488 /DNA_ORIENTATION=+
MYRGIALLSLLVVVASQASETTDNGIIVFSPETAEELIFSSPIKKHCLFFTDADADHHDDAVSMFSSIASQYNGELLVVNVPHTEEQILNHFGVKTDDLPALVLVDASGPSVQTFPYGGDVLDVVRVGGFIGALYNSELSAGNDL